MKLIKPSFEIIEQESGLEGIYKQIERAGRICYKSESAITEDSAKEFVNRMIKSGHCYTKDSEVLTIDGWKRWEDYSNEKIAVINSDGTFKSFETPKDIINKEYSGNFYNYSTLGIKVTDGHRMFGMFANSSEDRYKDFEGELFICNTPYQDANKRHKTLGERWFKTQCVCNYNNIMLKPYYQLIGFWLGDGCRDSSKDTLKFHLKKDRKVRYLTEVCLSLGYEFSYNNYHFNIKCDGIGEYFNSIFVLNQEKYIDLKFTEDLNEIYSIIDGLLNSDGSFQKTGISFSSTSEYLMNYIYSRGPLVGFNVSVGKWKKESTERHKQVERLFILKSNNKIVNDSRKPNSKVIITNESLQVYCVTVSTGLILVRGTNGVISICGNCAMLEHGTVYLHICNDYWLDAQKYIDNKYSLVDHNLYGTFDPNCYGEDFDAYITTNYRVLVENNWLDDLKYICEPTEHHIKRVGVKFILDRGISHEFVRHRVFSFAQESTRFCNYSKDQFSNECTFIIPVWLSNSITREGHYAWHCWCGLNTYGPGKDCFASKEEYENRKGTDFDDSSPEGLFISELHNVELTYFELLEKGWIAQQARAVLPNSLKTELIMTGFISDWWGEYLIFDKETGVLTQKIHGSLYESLNSINRDKYRIVESGFFPLRCSKSAHPQARELACQLREEFIKRKWIN